MCSLRLQYADLFHDLPMAHKITVNQTGALYFSQACSEDVQFLIPIVLFQSLWMFFMAGVHQQPDQSNYWLKVKLKLVNL